MEKYRQELIEQIKSIVPSREIAISSPPDPEMGDLALPCFNFAREMRKNPSEIASELRDRICKPDFIERMEVKGGYLNFFINRHVLMRDVITEIRAKSELYGSSMSGSGKKALIEHTSVNPNASPHVGRARNAMIGDFLVRLMRFEGYEVTVRYFVNDIGKQIAMLLLGAKEKDGVTFKDLLNIYIDINTRIENESDLEKEVFNLLYRLENGDPEIREGFRRIVDICVNGQKDIFAQLGIRYDVFDYESDYIWNGRTDRILKQLEGTGRLFTDEEGRFVLNLEGFELPMKTPFMVLTRSDGTSLYPLRDIAYTIDKAAAKSDMNIIVLGEDQKLYFQEVNSALQLLGYRGPVPVHYSFVLLSDGKMSTRKGTVVLLGDFMKEAVDKAVEEMEKRHGEVNEKTARAIAFGAVKYAILRADNDKNVVFDWESALSFEGDAGPYMQYSYARINSIFRKYGKKLPDEVDFTLLETKSEFELAKELFDFQNVVKRAMQELSPHVVANYVYGVTRKFSAFYRDCPVLNAENAKLQEARLALIEAVRQVVGNCLSILGIDTVDYM